MLLLHTWTVAQPVQAMSGGAALSETYGAAASQTGSIHPTDSRTAFDSFGVDSTNTFLLITAASNAPRYPIGAKVVWASRTFVVAAAPRIYQAGLGADHVEVLLEERA